MHINFLLQLSLLNYCKSAETVTFHTVDKMDQGSDLGYSNVSLSLGTLICFFLWMKEHVKRKGTWGMIT
jgi:hypothetical protein